MDDNAKCLENVKKIDPNGKLCDKSLCESVSDYLYRFCNCLPPNPPQNPCPYGPDSPVPVYEKTGNICYCCCSCAKLHTPIAVPEGEAKPIDTFEAGDDVLAAGIDLKWTRSAVAFSEGVPPCADDGRAMFSIYYRLPSGVRSLVVTADQVFLLADGTLRRAEFLVPGRDSLMAADGGPAPVLAIEVGGWFGGVHHIATSRSLATGLDGHLLNSNGIVTGDWALQLADIEGGEVAGAEIATGPLPAAAAAFVAVHGLEGDIFRDALKGAEWKHARHELFRPYAGSA